MTPHPLQPGAELDAEVAKAMGWKPDTSNGKRILVHDSLGVARDWPPYSTDIAAAWHVVAHLINDGLRFSLHTRTVGFEVHIYHDFPFKIIASETHKSAAAAICLAFLAAVASGRKERR